LKKKISEYKDFLLNYKKAKIDSDFYVPAVLNCEVKTLAYRLEDPKGKLLKRYD
jgi:hypothetical protein